jgi:diguanylate cyclase (GGDEF)-like protein/putative nucleotidyltransferase with HDIG domain
MSRKITDLPPISYRLTAYFIGPAFAVLSYAVALCAFTAESAALEQRPLPNPWFEVRSILSHHPFTLVAWIAVFTIISVIISHLFDREVYYRRSAEMKANIDGLTGAYNHRYFQDRLASEMERAGRYGRKLALVMFDLDDFKTFNDRRGHQDGDRLLKWFADSCRSRIRAMDVLARYGGEEFVVILPETGAKQAQVVADRIREGLEHGVASHFPNAHPVTVSGGVAAYPDHGQTRHALILDADTALYFAKRSGKNRVAVYEESFKKVYRATPDRLRSLLGDSHLGAIEALSAAVDAKDHYTMGHSDAVRRFSLAIGEKLGLSESDMENLKAAALLHDIGKIGTPDHILQKPGPLKADEWQVIEDHPKIGSDILEKVQQLNSIVPGVRHHHERFDGLGYPNGLSGKNIPLLARIIALADAYDAMTSERTYRSALPTDDALEELKRCAGTQFDPELVDLFIDALENHQAGVQQPEAA